MDRLQKQMAFLLEIDKLKTILRRNYLADGSRRETDAEHSWYFAIAASILAEHASAKINLDRVVRMGLIHDIVEVDAGDTFIYDEAARASQQQREEVASRRLFGMLPDDQAREFLDLWREFEANETAEARFARAIDRLVAVVLNHASKGKAWKQHGVSKEKILAVNERIALGSQALWDYVREIIEDAARQGFMAG